MDLDGQSVIEARVENVSETSRSTSISRGNTKVQTIEHVLAALAGNGITNAVIELDSNEPPIADGSSIEFNRLITKAGIKSSQSFCTNSHSVSIFSQSAIPISTSKPTSAPLSS